MKSIKPLLLLFFLAAACHPLQAALTETFTFSNLGVAIPDGVPTGTQNKQTISSSITEIGSVVVTLNISGSYNGDLYAFIQHGNGIAVLLNRSGRALSFPLGYADSGFQVTFADSAEHDVHTYKSWTIPASGSPLTGTWQPDARYVSPAAVLDTDQRTAYLDSLSHQDANGEWTLFLSDHNSGAPSTLHSWSLEITAVPEPVNVALALFGGFFLSVHLWRSSRTRL